RYDHVICAYFARNCDAIDLLLLRIFDFRWLQLVRRIFIGVLWFFLGLIAATWFWCRSGCGRRFGFGFSSAFGFGCGRRCGLFGLGVAEPSLSTVLRLAVWRRFFTRFAFGFLQILRLLVGQLDFIEDGVDSLIDLFLFVRSDLPLLFHLLIVHRL